MKQAMHWVALYSFISEGGQPSLPPDMDLEGGGSGHRWDKREAVTKERVLLLFAANPMESCP